MTESTQRLAADVLAEQLAAARLAERTARKARNFERYKRQYLRKWHKRHTGLTWSWRLVFNGIRGAVLSVPQSHW